MESVKELTRKLLARERIEVDMAAARSQLQGHTVMVTGAAGSIGSELVAAIGTCSPALLVLVDRAETPMHNLTLALEHAPVRTEAVIADITDPTAMERVFQRHRPGYVFHAAAYKHVPMMEENPYQAVRNNVGGTRITADLALRYGTRKFVMVSTDKAVNPTNVMGCSKRLCEIYVQSLDKAVKEGAAEGCTRFVTTRFGNVLGSNGSVIHIFREQIERGGPLTVTHPDITRYFMLTSEACKLVLQAGTMGHGGEIYVFDMGQPVRIADMARRMAALCGRPDIPIVYSGLRPGEKLYEELLANEETTLPTHHPKIKIARVREYAFGDVEAQIDRLLKLAATASDMEIVAAMKAIVPEFKSENSRYSVLDK